MQEMIKAKAIELLNNGTVDRVLGWKAGEFFYDLTPAVFTSAEQVEKDFVETSALCRNIGPEELKEEKFLIRAMGWILKVFAPLM